MSQNLEMTENTLSNSLVPLDMGRNSSLRLGEGRDKTDRDMSITPRNNKISPCDDPDSLTMPKTKSGAIEIN